MSRKKIQSKIAKESKVRQYPLLNLYILISAIVQIIGQALGIFVLQMLKPIPMILMIFYISGKNSIRDHLVPKLIKFGLAVSLIGDIIIMINEMSAFMVATIFFLIAHIIYCVAFSIGQKVRQASKINKIVSILVCFVYFGIYIGNMYMVWDKMPNKFLFLVYGFVLLIMNIFAIKRYTKTTPYSFGFIVAGGLLFGLSDNLLSLLKFHKISSSIGRAIIMLLYYSSQYLIMHGSIHHSNLQYQITKFIKNTGSNITPSLAVGKSSKKLPSRQWDYENGQQLPNFDRNKLD